ncbi:Neurexin-2 [Manis pentadactyla]|nr:Neurexin-2 [Manis pentadactyla]
MLSSGSESQRKKPPLPPPLLVSQQRSRKEFGELLEENIPFLTRADGQKLCENCIPPTQNPTHIQDPSCAFWRACWWLSGDRGQRTHCQGLLLDKVHTEHCGLNKWSTHGGQGLQGATAEPPCAPWKETPPCPWWSWGYSGCALAPGTAPGLHRSARQLSSPVLCPVRCQTSFFFKGQDWAVRSPPAGEGPGFLCTLAVTVQLS